MCLVRVFIFVKKAEQMYEITERRNPNKGFDIYKAQMGFSQPSD